jgi:outer membrane lipoprotein-sorting protein
MFNVEQMRNLNNLPNLFLVALMGVFLLSEVVNAASDPTALKLVAAADEARLPNKDVRFEVQVEDRRGSKTISSVRYLVKARAGGKQSLVDTLAPPRQIGRKLLMKDDDLWFYTPSVKRPTRVNMAQRLTGEVANGDIARTNFAEDYDATLVGHEQINGKKAAKLNLKAKRPSVTYSKILYWVTDDASPGPVKAEFFAKSGKLLKRAHYDEMRPVLGKPRATRVTIEDAIQPTRQSVMTYSKHKLENFDGSIFNKDNLSN